MVPEPGLGTLAWPFDGAHDGSCYVLRCGVFDVFGG